MEKNAQPLLPAYLACGADDLKRETVMRRLRERIAREADLEFNFDGFNGETAEGADIVAACNTMPFASAVRLVQVDAADKLKAADRAALVEYLKNPAPTCVLCLVAASLPKNTQLYKAVAKLGAQAVIDCAPPKRKDLPAQVRAMAMTHGITITPSAANALVDRVGENTVALDGQLAKLALAHQGADPVNENEVSALVQRTAEAKPWEFVDAFSQRNVQKCLLLRKRLPSASPYTLLAMCVTRVRELMMARALLERGRIGALPDILKVPEWRCKNHGMWARGFTAAELRQALVAARDAEHAMKTGADPEAAFEQWYLQTIRKGAR